MNLEIILALILLVFAFVIVILSVYLLISKNKISYLEKAIIKLQTDRTNENILEKAKAQFSLLAQEILQDKASQLKKNSSAQLENFLNPVKESFCDFKEAIDLLKENSSRRQGELVENIKALTQKSLSVEKSANDLASALKSQNKLAGTWGELVLERALEISGLVKGEEFFVQENSTQDGKRFLADILIKLPENRSLIIDSKMSLNSYIAYSNSNTKEEKDMYAKALVTSIKSHIKNLSSKQYHLKFENSPDFTIMFIPLEPAYILALQTDSTLIDFAFERQISIVCSSNLLAILKTVSNLWNVQKQNKNTAEIARLGGSLYNKVSDLMGDIDNIYKSLEKASLCCDSAKTRLLGKAGIASISKNLEDLGAKVKQEKTFSLND